MSNVLINFFAFDKITDMETLTIKNLTIKYLYGAMAISDLSLTADKGEILAVTGDTESGKTSLLKCIAGLVPVGSGKIFIDGKNVTESKCKERNVCLVYEDGCFFENRSAEYNIAYPMKIRKIDKFLLEEKVISACEAVGFPREKLRCKAKKLSGEERFLLSLARAYNRDADVYLFDDPLKNVKDREEYFAVLKDFMQKKADSGAVIYATSSGKECRELNGKCVLLNYGICLQNGDLHELISKPRSVGTIRKFLPEATIIEGKITIDNGSIVFKGNGIEKALDEDKLMSDIFIGKECLGYSDGQNLFLYDVRSERIIYVSNSVR